MAIKHLSEPTIASREEGQEILSRVGKAWVDSSIQVELTKLSNCILTALAAEQKCTILKLPVHFFMTLTFCFLRSSFSLFYMQPLWAFFSFEFCFNVEKILMFLIVGRKRTISKYNLPWKQSSFTWKLLTIERLTYLKVSLGCVSLQTYWLPHGYRPHSHFLLCIFLE